MRRVWLMQAVICISIHAYFLRVITLAYPGDTGALYAGLSVSVLMTAVLALSRVLQEAGEYKAARGLSLTGTPWLVLLTWFCALALPMDLWNLAVGKAGQRLHALAALRLPPKATLAFSLLLVARGPGALPCGCSRRPRSRSSISSPSGSPDSR